MGRAQARRGRHGEVAVEEGRHDLDQAQGGVCLAFVDGADRVGHEQVAVVGVLELLDGEVGRLLRVEIAGLVAVLDLAPDRLERVVGAHWQRKLAALEAGEGVGAVGSVGVVWREWKHLDGQSHARAAARGRHSRGHVARGSRRV